MTLEESTNEFYGCEPNLVRLLGTCYSDLSGFTRHTQMFQTSTCFTIYF